jgi:hypothetical protein
MLIAIREQFFHFFFNKWARKQGLHGKGKRRIATICYDDVKKSESKIARSLMLFRCKAS